MIDTIKAKDGNPFSTEKAAKLRAGQLKKSKDLDLEPVEVEGGFVLKMKDDTDEDTEKAVSRQRPLKDRIPVSTRKVLKYPEKKGYRRRMVNDTDTRIQTFIEGGWTPVEGDEKGSDPRAGETSIPGNVVKKSVGQGVTGVLMEIPEELYEEDQAAKQKRISKAEDAMRKDDKTGKGIEKDQYGKVEIG